MKILLPLALIALLGASSVAAQTFDEQNQQQLKAAQELAAAGHKPEALAELHKILDGNGFDPVGFYNLGNAFARLGESESAIRAYRRAIEQRPAGYSRAQNNLGVVLLSEGRWDEAYNAFNAALQIENFRYAEASYNLGRLYAARGERDLAVREWRRALLVNPKHTGAAQALARGVDDDVIVVEKRPAVVKRMDKPATASTPVPMVAKASASGRPGKLTIDQTSYDFLQRGRSASERGKMVEAVDNFRRVLDRQGGYFAPANLELSYALLSLQRYDEALGQLLQVSQRDGARYPVSYFHLGRVYEMKGELKLAEAAFSQTVDAYGSRNVQFLLDLSRVREKQNDYKGALEAMERYANLAEQQGQKPAWCDERLAELRAKAQ
jgi:tetratricopeptide (TPR) repeat protein